MHVVFIHYIHVSVGVDGDPRQRGFAVDQLKR